MEKYSQSIQTGLLGFDLVIVDFMALIFSKPPPHIYSSAHPLEEYCSWLVNSFIIPYLESSRVIMCIDCKDLDELFPIKSETHKKKIV